MLNVICDNAFFLPRLAEAIDVFFDLDIAHVTLQRADFISGFLGTILALFLPALSLFPGDTPVQEAICLDEGNLAHICSISVIIQAAIWFFIPCIDNRISFSFW